MNKKKPPQDYNYKTAKYIDRIWNIIFLISIIIAILQRMNIVSVDILFATINSSILIFLFFLEHLRGEYINKATIIRRKNLFDTTFDLKRIPNRADGFYDNQDVDDKIIKLFANNQESIYYTENISLIMLRYNCIYVGIIALLFTISIFISGITEINSITLVLLLSYFGFGRMLDIRSVYISSNKLFEESLRIANDMESEIKESHIAEILEVIVNYESIISSMNFVLSERIFNNKKDELKVNWTEIKKTYKIYN